LRRPANWWKLRNPVRPSWGEPYLAIAYRMLAAVGDAREAAAGHEAVLVSHQLPIWTLRWYLERRRLWHDPRRRQCGLASLTPWCTRTTGWPRSTTANRPAQPSATPSPAPERLLHDVRAAA
jgi:broad specificity phosphatase PhoE